VSECIDAAPKDHYCDICNAEMGEHKSNAEYPCESGKCDYCGADMPATTEHFYPNTCSKYCDYCGLVREVEEGGHVDVNPKDHCCDFCTEIVGDHADGDDNDHLCDYCNGEVEGEECVDSDTDKDHLCDECGEPCGDHIYGEGVYTAPTTERNAYYTYTCNCGHSYDEEVPNTKLYTVVFQNWNGDVISSQTYQYGDTVVVPADPTKPEDEKYTYTFAGWTPAVVEVTGDATYTAEFTAEEKVVEHYVEFNTSTQVYLELEDIVYFVVSGLIDKTDFTTEELLDRIGLLVWTPDNSLTAENALYGTHDKVFNEARMNGSRVELITDGIPARDLADAMTFRLYVDLGNGNYAYGKLVSNYSITDKYCVSRVNKGDWDAEVCRALLNYAAAAQEYFASSESQLDYSYTKLANAGLNETQKVVNWREDLVRTNWSVPEAKEGALVRNNNVVTSRQVYLQLESKVLVTFSYAISGDIQKAEILYWTEEQYNSVDVLTEENATGRDDLELFGGRYEATYPGQAAKDMFKTIYACAKITDSNGNVSYSGVVGYSPERYVASNYNKANLPYTAALAKALAVYGDAARSAFGE